MLRFFPLLLAMVLSGCGPDYSPDVYTGSAVQQAAKVEQGIVVGVRRVGVAAQGTTGAVTGAAAGGTIGSQIPAGGDVASTLGALGGSLIGGLVGRGVERTVGERDAYEYIVRKPAGELISVTQRDAVPLALGERVLVIAGSQARIVPDYTVPAEPAPVPSPVTRAPMTQAPVTPAPVTQPSLALQPSAPQPIAQVPLPPASSAAPADPED